MKKLEMKINLRNKVDDKAEKKEQHIWFLLLSLLS